MLTFNYTRTSKPAVGTQVSIPFAPWTKTLSQADVDAMPAIITSETLTIDTTNQTALESLLPAGAQVHLTPAQLGATYTKTELLQALGAQS